MEKQCLCFKLGEDRSEFDSSFYSLYSQHLRAARWVLLPECFPAGVAIHIQPIDKISVEDTMPFRLMQNPGFQTLGRYG